MAILIRDNSISKPKGALLWDLDGTLVRRKKNDRFSVHLAAIGLDPETNNVTDLTGFSDWEVISHYSEKLSLSRVELKKSFLKLDEIQKKFSFDDFHLCEGINFDLFSENSNKWENFILTGNTKFRANFKLQSVGLKSFFKEENIFYCKFNESRLDIAKRASKKIHFNSNRIIVIGDTLNDIRVAKAVNFRTLAVASGNYSFNELNAETPNHTIENFSADGIDLDQILEKIISS